MEPLDLRHAPPRSPRAQLSGLVFTARVVDKLRASLPGGELNGYFPDTGMSAVWSHYSGIPIDDLRAVVESAADEAEVEAWIAQRTANVDKPRFNAKLESFEVARIPEAWRDVFNGAYPPELRAAHRFIFDLLEADDLRANR
ncbi:MAG TPA: DUF5069 domain-containing protein [Candidatus Baltobacteraceae bacterium]|jgi:hypothetical protein|nr:DUF5069 domain-containing protein [Candidatus Baltobacteraceae bacterium]